MTTLPPAHPVRLTRRTGGRDAVVLDGVQRAVVDLPRGSGPVVVTGAPGSGKTTAVVESVVARVARGEGANGILVLTAGRRAASRLRDRITARVARTLVEPPTRTPAAYAFSLIRNHAVAVEEPLPRLISGPEQDVILAELLAGHREGQGRDPRWPDAVVPALELRGLRHELRDLLMRCLEAGVSPERLAELGRDYRRPAWVSAASVLEEYLQVTALAAPGAFDPAAIVDAAVELLDSSPDLLAREQQRFSFVAVDDAQEMGEAVARLLDRIRPPGTDLLLVGDPDTTTQSFRGADPRLLAQAHLRYVAADGSPAREFLLSHRWRMPSEHEAVVRSLVDKVGVVGGARHRLAPAASGVEGEFRCAVMGSTAQQSSWVARLLRDQHVNRDVPWGRMAVIVRTGSGVSSLQRTLAASGVPTTVPSAEVALRDEPAVRPLLLATRGGLAPPTLTEDVVVELLTSPLGGADALALRRLRRHALAAVPTASSSGEALAHLVRAYVEKVAGTGAEGVAGEFAYPGLEPLRQVTVVLGAVVAAGAERDATAESVLWAAWQAGGLAEPWRAAALAGGRRGQRADRDLDAVVALFAAAARHVERLPGAAPLSFLDVVEAQEVPEDTLAARAPEHRGVAVLTPQSAVGGQWEVVVVASVQDGMWPDLRLRGSFLGTSALADVLSGRAEEPDGVGVAGEAGGSGRAAVRSARAQVLADERRLFHVALTRSTRVLAVCAVSGEEEQPSELFETVYRSWLRERDGKGAADASFAAAVVEYPRTSVKRPVSLVGVVGELRRVLLSDAGEHVKEEAALELARLAREGIPGAHPAEWYGTRPLSDAGELWENDLVPVSPSALETFVKCPLRWMLQRHGGQGAPTTRQAVGILVHAVAEEFPEGGYAEMETARAEAFSSLGLPDTWVGERENARSAEMVRKLAGYVARNSRELVATELSFAVKVGRARLSGRVDRLERDARGRLVVVDLKTGSQQPTKAELARHPQLGAYQAAVEAGAFASNETGTGAEPGGAYLVQLGGKQQKAPEQAQLPLAQDENPGWAAQMVSEAAQQMNGPSFLARVSKACDHCPVRASCPLVPEGRTVLDLQPALAGGAGGGTP